MKIRSTRLSILVGACVTAALMMGFAGPAWATSSIRVDGSLLEFNNPNGDGVGETDDIGVDAQIGDTFDYLNVFPGVDARVEVVSWVNIGDEVDKVDEGQDPSEPDYDDTPLWVEIDPPGANGDPSEGSATLRVDFFESGGTFSTPVLLSGLSITIQDIDEGQYLVVEGIESYSVSSQPPTLIRATQVGSTYTFADSALLNSSATDEENWIAIQFLPTSSVTFTVGAVTADDAEFGARFAKPNWTVDPTVVVVATQPELANTGAREIAPLLALALGLGLASAGAFFAVRHRRSS